MSAENGSYVTRAIERREARARELRGRMVVAENLAAILALEPADGTDARRDDLKRAVVSAIESRRLYHAEQQAIARLRDLGHYGEWAGTLLDEMATHRDLEP